MSNTPTSDGSQNLTPTDEREIAKHVTERALSKDEALWKGYVEVNFENPEKVKKDLKYSKRVLAVTRYRLYYFKVKKCEPEGEFSLLDCVQISSVKPNCLTLTFKKGLLERDTNKLEMIDKGKTEVKDIKGKKYFNISTNDNRHIEASILKVIRESIRHSTDSWPIARLKVEAVPPEWLLALSDYKPGIASGFLSSYLAVSDYRGKTPDRNFQLFVKSIVAKQSKELILNDCPGIDQKAWSGGKPTFDFLVASEILEYNTYFLYESSVASFTHFPGYKEIDTFRSLVIQNVDQKDTADAISRIMMRNKTITRLIARNCHTTFNTDFGYSIFYNKSHALSIIDLSENSMPSAGLVPFAHSLLSIQHVLRVLRLHSMDISAKGLMTLAKAFCTNWGMSISVEELDISNNTIDSAATEAWVQWFRDVGSDSHLTRLSLAYTGITTGAILPYLAALPLQYLNLSGLKYNKGDEDLLATFAAETKTINILRVSDSGLSAEAIRKLISAIAKNTALTGVHLDLSKNVVGSAGSAVFIQELEDAKNILTLNIASAGLKAKGLVPVIQKLPQSIETFICDDNFESSGEVQSEEMVQAFAKLIATHDKLTGLSIEAKKGSKESAFGPLFGPILKALKSNTTLTYLNIANQECGDSIFSQLCRVLYRNKTLTRLKFPGNNITYNGFIAFDQALLHNDTLNVIEFFEDIAYEKLCLGTNKYASGFLSTLHQKCILRQAGAETPKNLFNFDSVAWKTPDTVTPLPPVPPRLDKIKMKFDWAEIDPPQTAIPPAPPAENNLDNSTTNSKSEKDVPPPPAVIVEDQPPSPVEQSPPPANEKPKKRRSTSTTSDKKSSSKSKDKSAALEPIGEKKAKKSHSKSSSERKRSKSEAPQVSSKEKTKSEAPHVVLVSSKEKTKPKSSSSSRHSKNKSSIKNTNTTNTTNITNITNTTITTPQEPPPNNLSPLAPPPYRPPLQEPLSPKKPEEELLQPEELAEEPPRHEEPVQEPPPFQEPVQEPPSFQEPVEEPPQPEEPVQEPPPFQEPVQEPPSFQEPVYEQPPVETQAYGEPVPPYEYAPNGEPQPILSNPPDDLPPPFEHQPETQPLQPITHNTYIIHEPAPAQPPQEPQTVITNKYYNVTYIMGPDGQPMGPGLETPVSPEEFNHLEYSSVPPQPPPTFKPPTSPPQAPQYSAPSPPGEHSTFTEPNDTVVPIVTPTPAAQDSSSSSSSESEPAPSPESTPIVVPPKSKNNAIHSALAAFADDSQWDESQATPTFEPNITQEGSNTHEHEGMPQGLSDDPVNLKSGYTHQPKPLQQTEEEKAYQLKFKQPNFLDVKEESTGPVQIQLRKPVQREKLSDPEPALQIQLRHVSETNEDSNADTSTPLPSGAMRRGNAPPPPPPKDLLPSQIAQRAQQQQQNTQKPVSLTDELSNAVRNARHGLRKVQPPEEKNYALEEKISITPFSHFAKNLEEHTVTSEEIKQKLAKAEMDKQNAQNAIIDEFYPLGVLQNSRPEHCVPERVHLYLSDAEFLSTFQMDKEAFAKLPLWKQNDKRKHVGLF